MAVVIRIEIEDDVTGLALVDDEGVGMRRAGGVAEDAPRIWFGAGPVLKPPGRPQAIPGRTSECFFVRSDTRDTSSTSSALVMLPPGVFMCPYRFLKWSPRVAVPVPSVSEYDSQSVR